MEFKLGNIFIKDLQFGSKTEVKDQTLFVNKDELTEYLLEDEHLASVAIDIARPGESVRIMPCKDVIEPRVKPEQDGGIFPGMVSKMFTAGQGTTHVLKGVAVVTTGQIVGYQEGIIDMTGPGAELTPFSQLNNLVIVAEPAEGVVTYQHEAALRKMGLRAANYLGEAARNLTPDETITYEYLPLHQYHEKYPDLPKVAYVYMLQSQGLLHDTYFYGVDVKNMTPTFMYPTEVMDGAIVSGNCVSACDKNTSYHHLNSPVIHDLLARHGKDLCFVGCVITNENVTLLDKQRSSDLTAKLVEYLGVDGVIISEEGFGNPDTDLIMNCNKIENKGIKTVLVTDEYAGQDGTSQSLADGSPLANAIVTGGNANELVTLPVLDKVIGNVEPAEVIAGGFKGSRKDDGTIVVELQAIMGATNELGFNKLTAREY
ncbi:MAG TPA: beta-aspartyl-peptidase [Firmicutes bacterium]|jgi:glycine reductase|nr:beta-aspartyl-peptidase [Bacillota bacterium]